MRQSAAGAATAFIARLKSKVGEITMDNELLYAKIAAMEGKRPLAHRRSRSIERIEHLGAITARPVLGGLHHHYCRI
jgi:hypothetical protein